MFWKPAQSERSRSPREELARTREEATYLRTTHGGALTPEWLDDADKGAQARPFKDEDILRGLTTATRATRPVFVDHPKQQPLPQITPPSPPSPPLPPPLLQPPQTPPSAPPPQTPVEIVPDDRLPGHDDAELLFEARSNKPPIEVSQTNPTGDDAAPSDDEINPDGTPRTGRQDCRPDNDEITILGFDDDDHDYT